MRASFDVQKLDIEQQRRVRGNRAAGAARAVAELGGNDQGSRAADLHPGDALVPASDDLPGAELERERVVAVARAVELLPVMIGRRRIVEPPRVVHRHGLAGGRFSASPNLAVRYLQARDV